MQANDYFNTSTASASFSFKKWLAITFLTLFVSMFLGLFIIMTLNLAKVNHILLPIFQYTALFGDIWKENALGAIGFITTKSLFAFTHIDPRSGLGLWSYEFNSITLGLYVGVSMLAAWLWVSITNNGVVSSRKLAYSLCFLGVLLLFFAISYMTSIKHCSGPTWVGFVSLYGLGAEELEIHTLWQWLIGVSGLFIALGSRMFLQPNYVD